MEDESGFVNLVVWPAVYERYKRLIKTEAFVGVDGRLQVQQGVVHLIAERFWRPDIGAHPRSGPSHDFR